jgi:hypothetical protein
VAAEPLRKRKQAEEAAFILAPELDERLDELPVENTKLSSSPCTGLSPRMAKAGIR